MGNFNLADVWGVVAETQPDRPAQRHGDRVQTWAEFDRRARSLAADLLDAGLGQQAKVAAYLYNGPEYLETYAAAFKAGLVPVNTNYRYGPEEVVYLLGNADAEAVVFDVEFAPLLGLIRDRLPLVTRWYAVGGPAPDWAVPYEEAASSGREADPPWGRSGDDLLLLYTGGTTGMPKGVMWRQDDLFGVLGG
ncbi:MAG: AMP-binding protein, partial [Actinomycetes bacterium]